MKIFVNIVTKGVLESFFPNEIRKKLKSIGEIEYNTTDHAFCGQELATALKGADILITGWNQPLIRKEDLGDIKLIVHTGGSVGGIVDLSVFDTDVKVISGNNYYAESVAEGTLSYMLMALRKMGECSDLLKSGIWNPLHNEGLFDKTVGIVSLGSISRKLIPMLKMFRTKIKVYSKIEIDYAFAEKMGYEYDSLENIFKTCDIVTVHTAKKPETDNMINDKHFKLLKKGALFVNTSRGSVIDEQALIENLKENRFHAVLDVYQHEPLAPESELLKLDNVILFPHMGGPTYDRRKFITSFLIDDAVEFFSGGELKNLITKKQAENMTVIG